jgi:hypothetical protein
VTTSDSAAACLVLQNILRGYGKTFNALFRKEVRNLSSRLRRSNRRSVVSAI